MELHYWGSVQKTCILRKAGIMYLGSPPMLKGLGSALFTDAVKQAEQR